ncbi:MULTISPECIES: uroporphyrinogen-III C-methyltransferase [unclassified Lebetimonas]|uniref:uroporphyrinogen-III C-methyltransferase n=1 Tax=unclassified Lebetimonas TaxID=2648158 RepID=UPI0004649B39|nr:MULTISPECIES: uroporphyrinogen-III C-methyltransferase [unclassified Lebetimonas]
MLINLKIKKALIIGAGKVAKQKADVLNKCYVEFDVIAKEKIDEFNYPVKIKEFEISDLNNYDIVIDATGNEEITKKLVKNKKFLLNVVDKPKFCDFYFGSIAKKDDLEVCVSSNGKSPRLTQVIRDRVERILPDSFEIDRSKDYETIKNETSKVFLIGCGSGDTDLLTIRAYNTLKTLDVALYDHLINPEILDLLPKACEKIYVGKIKGKHSRKQEEINEFILKYAKNGKIVGRLKSGHPFIYGRGAEELEAITKEGINVEVVEGLSSAISAPTFAGIPLTIRGKKDTVLIVSAHLRGKRINLEWIEELRKDNLRIVVLMGLSRSRHIQKKALEIGIDPLKKVAIINSLKKQVVKTTLENLVKKAKEIEKPAVIVF